MKRLAAVALVAGLCLAATALAACSGGGPEAEIEGARAGTATTTAPPPTVEEDRASAQRLVLTAADMPRLSASKPTGYASAYVECTGNQLLPTGNDARQALPAGFLRDETAEVRRVQTTGVGSWAVLAPTEDDAKAAFALLRQAPTRACIERRFASAVDNLAGSTVVQGTSTEELAAFALGDESVAFRTRLVQRGQVNFDLELTAIRRGRALAYIVTGRLGNAPFEESERRRLVTLTASRMG